MKILSFYQPVVVSTQVLNSSKKVNSKRPPIRMAINPGGREVINDESAQQIYSGRTSLGDWECPHCEQLNDLDKTRCHNCGEDMPVTPPVPLEGMTDFMPFYMSHVRRPQNWRGKRVLFYRNRGIGDQLISSALSRFFSEMLKAQCYQLSDRIHELLWCGNPYIYGQPVRLPLSIDSLIRVNGKPFFDWFFPMESVSEFDTEIEQGNVYDRLFAQLGFDPSRIPEDYKRPYWALTEKDLEDTKTPTEPYVAFQLRATNVGRTIPLTTMAIVLSELDKLGLPILCMDDDPLDAELAKLIGCFKNARDISGQTKTVRNYGTLIRMAKLVVGPDSSAIHFAASGAVPCISMWGSFHPDSRVKYYKNHVALFHPEYCQHAPCFNWEEHLPYHKCPNGKEQKNCAVFDGVQPEEIATAIKKLGILR